MTLAGKKAAIYAREHLQAVRICWLDRQPMVVGAVEAVEMCSNPRVSWNIVGVVAQDKQFEKMLHCLLDAE